MASTSEIRMADGNRSRFLSIRLPMEVINSAASGLSDSEFGCTRSPTKGGRISKACGGIGFGLLQKWHTARTSSGRSESGIKAYAFRNK
jgi:hypothetical protein